MSKQTATATGVFLSQIGFTPAQPKTFVLDRAAAAFDLRRAGEGAAVFKGRLKGPLPDRATGRQYWLGNFTALRAPGTYELHLDGKPAASFRIGEDVWDEPRRVVLHSYYLQRCGTEVDDPVTGLHHAPCHPQDGILRYDEPGRRAGEPVDATGGWHDAGDYGKYIPPAAVSIALMLLAYELYPAALGADDLGLPESGNGLPDVLDEARWELLWLLKMQRRDGGVHHKLAGDVFSEGIPPEDDRMVRNIYAVSTSATAKFAAAMAFAARIFRPLDGAFAGRALAAAEAAWGFLRREPFAPDPGPPDNTGSGAYAVKDVAPDLLWAALELYETTGAEMYRAFIEAHPPTALSETYWGDGSAIGMFHHARHRRDATSVRIHKLYAAYASAQVKLCRGSVFGISLAKGEFKWGSNSYLMGRSVLLILADLLAPRPLCRRFAALQLAYIFGCNPLGKTYVTGLGANPVRHPHQRLAWGLGCDVPGQMSGGPNEASQSGREPRGLGALSYVDEAAAYSCNEYAIDYNANLFFVLAAFSGRKGSPPASQRRPRSLILRRRCYLPASLRPETARRAPAAAR